MNDLQLCGKQLKVLQISNFVTCSVSSLIMSQLRHCRAWLRCNHALQEGVLKRWALSCHYLTKSFISQVQPTECITMLQRPSSMHTHTSPLYHWKTLTWVLLQHILEVYSQCTSSTSWKSIICVKIVHMFHHTLFIIRSPLNRFSTCGIHVCVFLYSCYYTYR